MYLIRPGSRAISLKRRPKSGRPLYNQGDYGGIFRASPGRGRGMMGTLRPVGPRDETLLRHLILDIAAELGASALPEPMLSYLLDLQYEARRHPHGAGVPETSSRIIRADEVDAGWLMTATLPHEVRLVEIMVLPEWRTAAIRFSAAAAAGKPLRLEANVTKCSAIALYERLGFRRIDCDEVQHLMEYTPPS